MYTQDQMSKFSQVAESLKKYRRADLLDEAGKSMIDALYVDLLPGNMVLNKCLLDNTTYLIGRKGTGKSTIFLKLENELRVKKGYLPCYIDVKTFFESSKAQTTNINYLNEFFSVNEMEKYLLERTFIQNILGVIYKEIDEKSQTLFAKVKNRLAGNSNDIIKAKIKKLIDNIKNNENLKSIEIPTLQTRQKKLTSGNQNLETQTGKLSLPGISISDKSAALTNDSYLSNSKSANHSLQEENGFTDVFLKIFEIKSVIEELSEILSSMDIKHLVILLDDVSEISPEAIKVFIDTIVAPLNNWSNEFIKFKVAFYPNRVHYGDIDPGKIDIIKLDFYDLYSEFGANKMEQNAISFTKRLLDSRFESLSLDMSIFFDTSNTTIRDYYELIFKVSMNVPRIIGYILSYVYQSKVIHGSNITKTDIERASRRYFEEKISAFFDKSVYCIMSSDERKTVEELKQLEKLLVNNAKSIKQRITTRDLSGQLYDPNAPFSSHFYVFSEIERYLDTLELNHFISKYEEKSDRDGKKISVYCLNHGLSVKNNILWGRKYKSGYNKYFTQRVFNYTKSIVDLFSHKKVIVCSNVKCSKTFSEKDLLEGLKFTNMKCPSCHSIVVVETLVDHEFEALLASIQDQIKLPKIEYKILLELSYMKNQFLLARDLSEEVDFSSVLIAKKCKKLDEEYEFVERDKSTSPYRYRISQKGLGFIGNSSIEY